MPMYGAPSSYVPPSAVSGYGPGTSYTNTTGGTNAIDALVALIAKEARPRKAAPQRPATEIGGDRAVAAAPVRAGGSGRSGHIAPSQGFGTKLIMRTNYPGGVPNQEVNPFMSDPKAAADNQAMLGGGAGSSQIVADPNPTQTTRAASALAAPGQSAPNTYAKDPSPVPTYEERYYKAFGRTPQEAAAERLQEEQRRRSGQIA